MQTKLLLLIVLTSLLFAGCSPSAAQSAEPTALPPVIADTAIMAEGRLEPVHFARQTTGNIAYMSQRKDCVKKSYQDDDKSYFLFSMISRHLSLKVISPVSAVASPAVRMRSLLSISAGLP